MSGREGARSTTPARCRSPGGRSFSANFNYTLSRTRPVPGVVQRDQQSLRFSTNFSPTPFWSLSWASQYNITDSKFESQVGAAGAPAS